MPDRPTSPHPQLPETPRLDVLIDRACRHLTPDEQRALREQVAVLQQGVTALDCMEREQRARAERAEQQAAAVRALHQPTEGLGFDCDEDDTPGSYGYIAQACGTCGTPDEYAVRWPCATIRALDTAGQPDDTPVGECGYVDGDRRCINRPGHDNPRRVHGPWVTHTTGQNTAETATGARESDEHPHAGAAQQPGGANGRHTPAQDRDEWAAIIAAEVDPHEAADRLITHINRQQNRP